MHTLMFFRTVYWPFLACLGQIGTLMNPSSGERCATKNNMNWDKINTCYQGDEGHA